MTHRFRGRFRVADIAQQVVGGFLLAGPFVLTEEVWIASVHMSILQWLVALGLVVSIGYGALYQADTDRDPEHEQDIGGIPARFLSLMGVSFGAVVILMVVFDAPWAFLADLDVPPSQRFVTTLHAVTIVAVFSVVGAATADSVF